MSTWKVGSMNESNCSCEELIKTIQDLIPLLLSFVCVFIFILLMYRIYGKSKSLYWFMLMALFSFDVSTIGLTTEYISAFHHVCSCTCDDEL